MFLITHLAWSEKKILFEVIISTGLITIIILLIDEEGKPFYFSYLTHITQKNAKIGVLGFWGLIYRLLDKLWTPYFFISGARERTAE